MTENVFSSSKQILTFKVAPTIQDFSDFYASSGPNKKVPWVINQNEKWKIVWDIYIMTILVIIIMIIPTRLAFVEEEPITWQVIFYMIDLNFGVDIVLWFFTSYTDPYKQVEITSHKLIAVNYLKSWFFIDFISTFPIDAIFSLNNLKELLRFVRIGKVYKLIRLFRLIKIFKLIKSNKKMMNHFSERMRISSGTERLVFFTFFFAIFLHVSSCLFIILGTITPGDEEDSTSWLEPYTELDDFQTYVVSVYFVLTTTSTVGYGDISPQNTYERLYGCALMLIGVLSFTFISGALSSILSSYDIKQAALQEKVL